MGTPQFVDNFWGEKDAGFDVMLNRMRSGKQTCKDVMEIVLAHAYLEDEYAKKLAKLAKMVLGKVTHWHALSACAWLRVFVRAFCVCLCARSSLYAGRRRWASSPRSRLTVCATQDEAGTMREALIAVRTELDQAAQLHANLAADLRAKVDKPLAEFTSAQSKTRKAKAKQMARVHKNKLAHQALVLKTRQAFQKRAQEAEQLGAQLRRPGLAGKEAEKLSGKERKAVAASQSSDSEFATAVTKLQRVQEEWTVEMRDTAQVCIQRERERWTCLSMLCVCVCVCV
jgi:hypothetical protein